MRRIAVLPTLGVDDLLGVIFAVNSPTDRDPKTAGYFQLNNFDNVGRAYVTLFELMVVNNWWVVEDS